MGEGRLSIEKAHMDILVSKWRKTILLKDIRICRKKYKERQNFLKLEKKLFHSLIFFIHILMGITIVIFGVIFEPK